MKIDRELLDTKLIWLGFREVTIGTGMLRVAIEQWRPGMWMTKELYPAIARQFGSTPSRVERAMRHAIETAFERGDPGTIEHCFAFSISGDKGKPTVSEFISRMARLCACEN